MSSWGGHAIRRWPLLHFFRMDLAGVEAADRTTTRARWGSGTYIFFFFFFLRLLHFPWRRPRRVWRRTIKTDQSTHPTRKGKWSDPPPHPHSLETVKTRWNAMGYREHRHRLEVPMARGGRGRREGGGGVARRRWAAPSSRCSRRKWRSTENGLDASRNERRWCVHNRIGTAGEERAERKESARRREAAMGDTGPPPPPPFLLLLVCFVRCTSCGRSGRYSYYWWRCGSPRHPRRPHAWPWRGTVSSAPYDRGRCLTPTLPDVSKIDETRRHRRW